MVIHFGQRHRIVSRITELAIVITILSFALAYVDTIWALYIDSFVKSAAIVGIVSGCFTAFSFLLFFVLIPYFERHSPSRTYLLSLIIYAIAYILFAINRNFYIFIAIALFQTIGSVLRRNSSGIIIRNMSTVKNIGKTESLIYNLSNIGWLIGPLVAGSLAEKAGINVVFVLAAIFVLMATAMFIFMKLHIRVPKIEEVDKNILRNFKTFFKNKNLLKIYVVGGGVDLYWAVLYIYLPLYIIRNGLGDRWVGYFLFAIVSPLVILEYYVGKKVDESGYKKYFMIGYGCIALIAMAAGLLTNVYWVMGLFVLASVPIAFLEPTTEAYFFKIIRKKDEAKYYGPYCTCSDVFSTVGKIVIAGFLFFLPFKWVFFILAVEMLFFFFMSMSLKKVVHQI
ncbi:hypothetical protein DRJ17_02585 [Candidatus Woesearchaeota archaeon]|nr:MAG: hypothetical protein DRJ17_02585 [Candidatus Woesearchaeota archaeon]